MAHILGDVNTGEKIEVSVYKKYKCNLPSFGMLGNNERRTKVSSIDMHGILKDLSKGSTWLFWRFIELRNPNTNIVIYIPKTTAERRKLTKAYKELNNLKIIKRVKQGEYLINPKAFIPAQDMFNDVKSIWDSLP